MKEAESGILQINSQEPIRIRAINNSAIWRAIAMFTENAKKPFYWKNIKEHLTQVYGIHWDVNMIRNILKKKLECSFKRWSPRPLSIDYEILKLEKILFSIKIWRAISMHTVLINVDESSISKSTKANYSWGLKGISLNLSNIKIRGSISLITAIMSNGISITGIKKGTIKSDTFIEFIKNLLIICKKL